MQPSLRFASVALAVTAAMLADSFLGTSRALAQDEEPAAPAVEETPAAPAAPAFAEDPAIVALARQAATGDYKTRTAATAALVKDHGAAAVGPLLRWIGTNSDVDARVQAVTTLKRLGPEALLAMVAGLHSPDAMARRNLCVVLGEIGDPRGIPVLVSVAERDVDDLARAKAQEALGRIGAPAGGNAAAALAEQSRATLAGEGLVAKLTLERVFFWNGSLVAHRALPAAAAGAAYARLLADDAVALQPDSKEAQDALLAAYGALMQALGGGGDDVAAGDWASALPRIKDELRLGGVLEDPHVSEPPTVEELAGAGELLASPDKRLRYKAALALFKNPSPEVVRVLGDALSESPMRQVLVIDNDPAELNSLVAMLNTRDVKAFGASTGAQGLIRAKEAPVKDAILIRSTIKDVGADQVVRSLSRDVRTQGVPVVILSDESERERLQQLFGDKVIAVVPGPFNAPLLKPALDGAFEKVKMNEERIAIQDFSHASASALATLDAAALEPARGALVGAIGREDAAQIGALDALARLAPAEAEAPAAAVFADAAQSKEARLAAGRALKGVLAANPAHPETIAALMAAVHGPDAELRSSACAALGTAMSVDVAQRSALLLENSLQY